MKWEQNYGGSNEDRGNDMIATSDGNYVIAGWTSSSNNDVSNNNGTADTGLPRSLLLAHCCGKRIMVGEFLFTLIEG